MAGLSRLAGVAGVAGLAGGLRRLGSRREEDVHPVTGGLQPVHALQVVFLRGIADGRAGRMSRMDS